MIPNGISKKSIEDLSWLDVQYHSDGTVQRPAEIEVGMSVPSSVDRLNVDLIDRIQGSMIGMALGDALGAHVEFRPYEYLQANPVTQLEGGGTWSLQKGQFTDDTSMALCLANSLISCEDFCPYDQLVRYKWWYEKGYMSSTGQCFDIGTATRLSLEEFRERQEKFSQLTNVPVGELDSIRDDWDRLDSFDVYCSEEGVAGNGALMRLAPVPLFFHRNIFAAIVFSGRSGEITHGDRKAADACRFYGALIAAALRGYEKTELLHPHFYRKHRKWFGTEDLHPEIVNIAEGSYQSKKGGYKDGIRGKGYIVDALEAALWSFWTTTNFEEGALAAVNLGDDTDTTAAIYGQLAGACYGYAQLPEKWVSQIYARTYLEKISLWIGHKGQLWDSRDRTEFNK